MTESVDGAALVDAAGDWTTSGSSSAARLVEGAGARSPVDGLAGDAAQAPTEIATTVAKLARRTTEA